MNSDDVFPCGGFDPYNSATTDARWFFLRAARDEQRRSLVEKVIEVMKANPEAVRDLFRAAYARVMRPGNFLDRILG